MKTPAKYFGEGYAAGSAQSSRKAETNSAIEHSLHKHPRLSIAGALTGFFLLLSLYLFTTSSFAQSAVTTLTTGPAHAIPRNIIDDQPLQLAYQRWSDCGNPPTPQQWLLEDESRWVGITSSYGHQIKSSTTTDTNTASRSLDVSCGLYRFALHNPRSAQLTVTLPLANPLSLFNRPLSLFVISGNLQAQLPQGSTYTNSTLNSSSGVIDHVVTLEAHQTVLLGAEALPQYSLTNLLSQNTNNNINKSADIIIAYPSSLYATQYRFTADIRILLIGSLLAIVALTLINALASKQKIAALGFSYAFASLIFEQSILGWPTSTVLPPLSNFQIAVAATSHGLLTIIFFAMANWILTHHHREAKLDRLTYGITALIYLLIIIGPLSPIAKMAAIDFLTGILILAIAIGRYTKNPIGLGLIAFAIFRPACAAVALATMQIIQNSPTTLYQNFPILLALFAMQSIGTLCVLLYIVRQEQLFLTRQSIVTAKREQEIATLSPLLHASQHNLKAPLSDIVGLTDLIADQPLNFDQKQHLNSIRAVAHEAIDSINALFSQRANQSNYNHATLYEPFSLSAVIDECRNYYQTYFKHLNVEIEFSVAADIPNIYIGNHNALRRILLHIYDYHAVLEARAPQRNLINLEHYDNQLRIALHALTSDEKTIASKLQNTLSLIGKIVQHMGGSFDFHHNKPIKTIYLPLEPFIVEETAVNSINILKGKQILIVDDNPTSARVLASYLERWHVSVHLAHDFTDALALVGHQQVVGKPIELGLVDYLLKDDLGTALIDAIRRQHDPHHEILMILVSNTSDMSRREDIQRLNLRQVLLKPVNADTLRLALIAAFQFQKQLKEDIASIESEKLQLSNTLLSERNVLLVEDNTVSANIMQQLLRRLGASIVVAHNGAEAIEIFHANHFDIVLLDCELPDISGLDVAQTLRRIEMQQDLIENKQPCTIIGVSANIDEPIEQRGLTVGMNGFCEKPLTVQKLQALLTQA